MKVGVLALTVFLWPPSVASAEWQVKPFLGVTFAGGTTLLEPEMAVGSPNVAVGINALLIGDMLGVEADLGYAPGFFQKGDLQKPLVVSSSATTLTANVLIAVPRHLTQYTLRPYFVGGGGLMHAGLLWVGLVQVSRAYQRVVSVHGDPCRKTLPDRRIGIRDRGNVLDEHGASLRHTEHADPREQATRKNVHRPP